MKKKILSVVLAMTMVMGLSISSFAANVNTMAKAGEGIEVSGTSTASIPTIAITVPTTTSIVINPFQMAVDLDGEGSGTATASDQIISAKQEITSASNVAVAVNIASFSATPAEGKSIAILTKSAKTATAKSVYLGLKIAPTIAADTPVAVAATTTGASKASALILAAGTAETPSKCEFQITGDCNANPTKTENKVTSPDPWATGDNVTVKIKFTFTPQIITE
jgi:hypothetical protein